MPETSTPRKAQRTLIIAAALGAALVGLYAALGTWLAPRLLLDAVQQHAASAGITLAVHQVRTDPFRLLARLEGIEAVGPQGDRLATARALTVDVAWASLWRDAWIVQHASLVEPFVHLPPEGKLASTTPSTAGPRREPPRIRIEALTLSNGTLRYKDQSVVALDAQAQGVSTHTGEAPYRLSGRFASGGTLVSSGVFAAASSTAHGRVQVAGMRLDELARLARDALGVRGELDVEARYAYQDGRFILHELNAEARDAAYAGVEARELRLHVPELAFPLAEAVALTLEAELAGGGTLAAKGSVRPEPPAAELDVKAAGLPIALAQRFLPDTVALKLASGRFSAQGRLDLRQGAARFAGAAELEALRLVARDTGQPLLGWKHARAEALRVELPGSMEIGEMTVRAPQARIAIEADGRVNLAAAFGSGRGARDGGGFQARVRRLHVEDGTLHFADRSLQTPFEVTIAALTGTLTGFSTEPGDPALVALTGRVGEYGSAKIRGTIDLDAPKSLADIRAQLRNVGVAQLTPYVVKFAGYRVRSGRLSADLRYRVSDARLSGQNELVFTELALGEKVQSAGAADLPLELAVALLADAQGRIRLDIPVRGNLNDPQFDFGGLIARALGNALGRIVSAPFRAIAGLFGGKGGDESLSEVRFAPGSAALPPPEEESVVKLAKALQARPQLTIAVRGGYDPQRDAQALRRELVRREIARRAGYQAGGPLDFNDPKIVRAAERLYLERIGKRADLQALRESAPRYGRALVDLLAYVLPEEAASADRLAEARGEAIRAALVRHGLDPDRVTLQPPSQQAAGEEGVPTQLALVADARASAGASAR